MRESATAAPTIRVSGTNVAVCVHKARAPSSCVPPHLEASSSQLAQGSSTHLQELHRPLMLDAAGGWTPAPARAGAWNATTHAFGMPRGVRSFAPRRGHVNAELGRDFSWLPVTRTQTQQDGLQVGLWFHYMRGCSDFAWSVGRTLLVRNKCAAAVAVELRASRNRSWEVAIGRVARKLARAFERLSFQPAWALWYLNVSLFNSTLDVAETARALHRCAHGHGLPAATSRTVRHIVGSSALDYVTARTLAEEHNATSGERAEAPPLDTIQFLNQCAEGTEHCEFSDGNVEVWDVRSLRLLDHENASAFSIDAQANYRSAGGREPKSVSASIRGAARRFSGSLARQPRLFGRLDGSACALSPSWFRCIACADSLSELACLFRCRCSVAPLHECMRSPSKFVVVNDTGEAVIALPDAKDAPWFSALPRDANPLALATLWRVSWGPLVGSVPPSWVV